MPENSPSDPVVERARLSAGSSAPAIYDMARRALARRHIRGELFLDIGCGVGHFRAVAQEFFRRYVGVDAARYPGFPEDAEFLSCDLGREPAPLADECADAVAALETIEHLENPRALMRELVRLAKPGGWILVTTPNQLSFLSLITLVVKKRFSAFQDVHYPAHLSALLEVDLRRMAQECRLEEIAIEYSGVGRIIGTARQYPAIFGRWFPRVCSDNVSLIGRKTGKD